MSVRLRLLNAYLRHIERPLFGRVTDPVKGRRRFERQAYIFNCPPFAVYLPDRIGGVDAPWCHGRLSCDKVILYFHGGGYVIGCAAVYRGMLSRLAIDTGGRACLPEYRLAPENPWPAALEDAQAMWTGLLDRGYRAEDIILGGDSAGGGLMLSLLSRICRSGDARPAAAFAMSPWTDLTLSGASYHDNARTEAVLPPHRTVSTRDAVISAERAREASPLFAEFPDCPPVFLQASRCEILRDDTLAMAEALRAQGAAVELDMWDDPPHVWPIFQGWLPEADEALARIAGFIRSQPRVPRQSGS